LAPREESIRESIIPDASIKNAGNTNQHFHQLSSLLLTLLSIA